MAKCKNESLQTEEFECSGCGGTGYIDGSTKCDLCGGAGFYLDACCSEHAEEYELDLYHQSQHMEPDNAEK